MKEIKIFGDYFMFQSIDIKFPSMRKIQNFVIYPVRSGSDEVTIQSDTRIASINITSGQGRLSLSIQMVLIHHLVIDKLTPIQLTTQQLAEINGKIVRNSCLVVGPETK